MGVLWHSTRAQGLLKANGTRQGWIGSNNDKQTEQDTKGLQNLLNGPLAPEE